MPQNALEKYIYVYISSEESNFYEHTLNNNKISKHFNHVYTYPCV